MKNLTVFLFLACATTFAFAQTISTTPPNSVPDLAASSCSPAAVEGAWGNSAGDGFPRRAQSIVYDSARDRLVEFGGTDKRNRGRPISSTDLIFNDEVWVRPASLASGWTRLVTAGTGPSSRGFHSAIYDPVADRMIVYGGVHTIRGLSDLWELDFRSDPPEWRTLTAGGVQPNARFDSATLYDAPRRRMLVCGGIAGNWNSGQWGLTNEFWALHLDGTPTWERIFPTGVPLGRRDEHRGVYDSRRDRWILAGGELAGFPNFTYPLDVLAVDLETMNITQIGSLPAAPYSLSAFSLDYDPQSDQLLLFGGSEAFTSGAQVMSLASPNGWRSLASAGATPETRVEHASFFDPVRNRLDLFGGGHTSNPFPDASVLSFGRETHAAVANGQGPVNPRSRRPVSIVISGTPDFPASEIVPATIRVGEAAPTTSRLEDADGDGLADLVVTVLARDIDGDANATTAPLTGLTFLGEPVCGAVDLPRPGGGNVVTTLSAAIGQSRVHLSSAEAGPLTIELRDIRGASVARQTVTAPVDGWTELAQGRRLPPGVYWARILERPDVPAVRMLILH